MLELHARAYHPRAGERVALANRGEYQWRRDGELHLFNPRTVQKLQHATRERRFDIFKEYTAAVDDQRRPAHHAARLLRAGAGGAARRPSRRSRARRRSCRRFSTGAMSYGSISEEAHTTLAIAMNRLGGELQHRRGR